MRTQLAVLLIAGGFAALALSRRRTPPNGDEFQGKVVAITGGSRGLGLELARAWLARGAWVAICARNSAELSRSSNLLGDSPRLATFVCDVREKPQAIRFVKQVHDRFGCIDVLVNNAGIIQVGPLDAMAPRDFEDAMATHFWGPLNTILAVLPEMRRRHQGAIVNIASIGGEISVPHLVPYSASKFALVGLSDGLAAELAHAGVRVTTVCPGLMRTGSPRQAAFKGRHREEYAWFSIGGSIPGWSISSHRAAEQIVGAVQRGESYLRIGLPAKLSAPVRACAPRLFGKLCHLIHQWLPRAFDGSKESWKGYESFSRWSPSWLTHLNEQAALRNNEVS